MNKKYIEIVGFTLDEIDQFRKENMDKTSISNTTIQNAREIYDILKDKPLMYPRFDDGIHFEWFEDDKDGFENGLQVFIYDDFVKIYRIKCDPNNIFKHYEDDSDTVGILEFKQIANKMVSECLNGTNFYGRRRAWRKKNKEE